MEYTTSPASLVSKVYAKLVENISKFKRAVGRPLTLTEKIIMGHLDEQMLSSIDKDLLVPGNSYVFLRPDRVALQDVTGQMTILQFMQAGIKRTVVPTTVHCDHLIRARVGEANLILGMHFTKTMKYISS